MPTYHFYTAADADYVIENISSKSYEEMAEHIGTTAVALKSQISKWRKQGIIIADKVKRPLPAGTEKVKIVNGKELVYIKNENGDWRRKDPKKKGNTLTNKKHIWTEEEDTILRTWANKLSTEEISKKLPVSKSTVHNRITQLRKEGIIPPPSKYIRKEYARPKPRHTPKHAFVPKSEKKKVFPTREHDLSNATRVYIPSLRAHIFVKDGKDIEQVKQRYAK